MPSVLHLLKPGVSPLAGETIRRQAAAGDRVTVVLLDGAVLPAGASGLGVRRVPEELSYAELLDLVFEADQVIVW
jgi:hypothetical protein